MSIAGDHDKTRRRNIHAHTSALSRPVYEGPVGDLNSALVVLDNGVSSDIAVAAQRERGVSLRHGGCAVIVLILKPVPQ